MTTIVSNPQNMYPNGPSMTDVGSMYQLGNAGAIQGASVPSSAVSMSIDELVSYLEMRLNKINCSIRDRMMDANKNTGMTKAASQLQATVGNLSTTSPPDAFNKAADEIDAFLKSCEGSTDISDTQREQLKTLSEGCRLYAKTKDNPGYTIQLIDSKNPEDNAMICKANACLGNAKNVKEMLGTVVTSCSHTDQANLANIQSLVSQMGQATSLVSNMIAAFNEGLKSIIGNTRT